MNLLRLIRRARRRAAYKVGLDWHMPILGYIIDVDRNRFAYPDGAYFASLKRDDLDELTHDEARRSRGVRLS